MLVCVSPAPALPHSAELERESRRSLRVVISLDIIGKGKTPWFPAWRLLLPISYLLMYVKCIRM